MCGILGGNQAEWNYKEALETIEYRGPDGSRIEKFRNFTLGFRRLAVMDLSNAAMQPMLSEDGYTALVFNGEIYGFDQLKNVLLKKGHTFQTHSDTEVILHAYLEYGDRFVNYIDGMFAIAILDVKEQTLKLFRDRVGIKPLYYYCEGKEFAFASELKELLVLCGDKKFQVDRTAVYDFFTYGYIPEPKSLYQNIRKLRPAHYIKYDLKEHRVVWDKPYWKLRVCELENDKRDVEEVKEEVHALIQKSVKEQLLSDVPVGSFLSGGIDSSVVSYEIRQLSPSIEAFSMGFTYKKYDEVSYAEILAEENNIPHHIQIAGKCEINQLYQNLRKWYDEPFADTSAFPTYLVSKAAKEKVTVVLTGDGGDEVFGGYSRYGDMTRREKKRKTPPKEQISLMFEAFIALLDIIPSKKITEQILEDLAVISGLTDGMLKIQKREWAKKLGIAAGYDDYWFYRKYYKKELPMMTRMQYMDFHTYLPGDILTKVDRATMQVSLEARVPLLSKELVEYMFRLPVNMRCPNGELKGLMKAIYRGKISEKILNRKKMGFCIPDSFLKETGTSQEQIVNDFWKEECEG